MCSLQLPMLPLIWICHLFALYPLMSVSSLCHVPTLPWSLTAPTALWLSSSMYYWFKYQLPGKKTYIYQGIVPPLLLSLKWPPIQMQPHSICIDWAVTVIQLHLLLTSHMVWEPCQPKTILLVHPPMHSPGMQRNKWQGLIEILSVQFVHQAHFWKQAREVELVLPQHRLPFLSFFHFLMCKLLNLLLPCSVAMKLDGCLIHI